MRAAALSVPSNIAEGQGRYTPREYRRFLRDARGSLYELQNHLLFAQQRTFLPEATVAELLNDAEEVGRLINGLIRYLSR
jgi:four helix bundle protein